MNDEFRPSEDEPIEDDGMMPFIPADDDLPEAVPLAMTDDDEPVDEALMADTPNIDADSNDVPAPLADDVHVFLGGDDDVQGDLPDLSIPDDFTFDAPALDDLDIEGALSSVASLSDVIAEREAQEQAEQARFETERRRTEEESAKRAAYYLPRPPMMRLGRGQLASVIPAFLLMALGAGLTVIIAAPDVVQDVALSAELLALVALGTLGALMIVLWVSSARWAGGALFAGVAIWASIGVLVWLAQPGSIGADGWPLLLAAVGVGALLSALFSQPLSKHQPFVGVALIVAGGVGAAHNAGLIDYDLTPFLPFLAAGLGVFVAVLLIAPIIIRKRG